MSLSALRVVNATADDADIAHLLLSSLRTEELKTLGGLDAPTICAALAAGV